MHRNAHMYAHKSKSYVLLSLRRFLCLYLGTEVKPIASTASFRPMGIVDEAGLPSNAYYPRTPDYTMSVGLNILSRHSFTDLCLDYDLGTMTTPTSTAMGENCEL